ncbi:MAG TPA: dephospho-CoA kinase [Bryobacteraceae bacterium]
MLRVGLTGGLASGKSFVGEELARLGCHVIQADDLGHTALDPGGAAYTGAIREFGPGIVDPDGTINRQRLAAEVFGKPERLAVLNGLIHPAVIRAEEEWMREIEARESGAIAVVEAAILIEAGSHTRFDKLIVAVCTPEQQMERAVHRGLTREEAQARLNRQMPLAEKRRYADFLIDTSGAKEETLRQVREVHERLRSMRK